jgi:hypothetical protein
VRENDGTEWEKALYPGLLASAEQNGRNFGDHKETGSQGDNH